MCERRQVRRRRELIFVTEDDRRRTTTQLTINHQQTLPAHHTDHTHTRLTALCPGLPGWAGTRNVKPIRILMKQEIGSGSGISWAICKSAPSSRQITMPVPHHSVFYRPDALPAAQPTASKHWRQNIRTNIHTNIQTRNRWHKNENMKHSQLVWVFCYNITKTNKEVRKINIHLLP